MSKSHISQLDYVRQVNHDMKYFLLKLGEGVGEQF